MASSKSKISGVSMTPAKNGVIISWTERRENGKKGTYDNCSYDYPSEVYDFDGENNLDKAFERFKELWKMQYPDMKY